MFESLVAQAVLGLKALLLAGVSIVTSDAFPAALAGRATCVDSTCRRVEVVVIEPDAPVCGDVMIVTRTAVRTAVARANATLGAI